MKSARFVLLVSVNKPLYPAFNHLAKKNDTKNPLAPGLKTITHKRLSICKIVSSLYKHTKKKLYKAHTMQMFTKPSSLQKCPP